MKVLFIFVMFGAESPPHRQAAKRQTV